jgi:hypothetical protein
MTVSLLKFLQLWFSARASAVENSNWSSLGLEAPRPPRAVSVPPARADRLKIFSLSRKDCLSVAEWLLLGLKGLVCKMDKKDTNDEDKNTCNLVGLRVPFLTAEPR